MRPRYIFHVDVNSCFASLEQQANPLWRHRPMGVVRKPQEFSVISAPSIEAKKRGVKTAATTFDAWKIIPDMLIVHEDPAKYQYWSGRIWRMLKTFTPDVEVFSVDEAFADMSQIVEQQYDGDPELLAVDIQLELEKLVGEWPTCSIGIARSKVLAKLAGETRKPNGITWIPDDQIDTWRARTPVDEVCGINKGWRWRLSQMGIHNMIDVDDRVLARLKRLYGLPGLYTAWLCQGKDPTPLTPESHHNARKGYGNTRELHKPYPDFKKLQEWLKILCHETAIRMRADNVCGRTVQFWAGSPFELSVSKRYTLPMPIDSEWKIFETCMHICELFGSRLPREFNGVAVYVTNLGPRDGQTMAIFERDRNNTQLMRVLDLINAEWGHLTVYPGWLHDSRYITPMFKANQAFHRDIDDQLDDEESDPIDWEDVFCEIYGMK